MRSGGFTLPFKHAFELSSEIAVEHRLDLHDLASARNGVGPKHRARSTLDTKFRIDVFTNVQLTPGVSGQVEDWMKMSEPLVGRPEEKLSSPSPVTKTLQTRRLFPSRHRLRLRGRTSRRRSTQGEILVTLFGDVRSPEVRLEALVFATTQFFAEVEIPVALDQTASLSHPDWINRLAYQTAC